jgi:hypothetical protein
MARHFNEQNRKNLGIVWLVIGMVFLATGFSGGLVFFILGGIWLATVVGRGLQLFRSKPDYMRTMLKNLTTGLLGLALVILSFNAIN